MKRLKDESGQALIITALCMTCLFGFIALAADVGIMFHERRLVQIAADGAAIAGASQVFDSGTPTAVTAAVQAAAQAAATQNGFTNGTGGATVTVNNPPSFGPHAGSPNYVEVIISQSQPTLFMNFFGIASMSPTARAVAFNGASTSANCIVVTSPNASPALDLQGSFTVTAPNCGVVVDSSDSNALHFTGGGGTLTAGSVGVVGGDGGQVGDSTPTPIQHIVPVSDPLGYLGPSFPTPTGCTAPSGGTLTGAVPAGCYSGAVTLNNAVLTGMYVFTGNLTLSHSVTSGAAGSTIDLTAGTLSETPNTTLNLVAPTDPTNTFHGIAIMAPASNTSTLTLEFGNATGTIQGIIYAPGAYLYLHDSGGGPCPSALSLITDLIVGTMKDQTGSLCLTSYSQTTPGSPLTKVTLVE